MDLAIASHSSFLSQSGSGRFQQQAIYDLGSGLNSPLATSTKGPSGSTVGGKLRPGLLVGGRFLDIPTSHGSIERFDLSTRTQVTSNSFIEADKTVVQGLIATDVGEIALLKASGSSEAGPAIVVKLDEALHLKGKLTLPGTDDRGFGRPGLSPDGNTLAIPLSDAIALVDLRAMAVIDQDPTTPDPDLISPGVGGSFRSVVFFTATDMIAPTRRTGEVAILHQTPTGYTVAFFRAPLNTKCFSAALAPDGRVWMAFENGLQAYDPTTDQVTPVTYTAGTPNGLAVVDGQLFVLRNGPTTGFASLLDQINTSGTVLRTIATPSFQGAQGHWLNSTR